jgi:succinoglycan biosynthesis transport protein ExoP
MPEGNFFANFNEILRARVEGHRNSRALQLGGFISPPPPQEPLAETPSAGMARMPQTLADYLRLAKRRWRLIAGTSVLLAAVAGGVTWYMPTRFRAETVLQLEGHAAQISDIGAARPPVAFDATTVLGDIDVLKSRALAEKVAQQLHLADEPDFAGAIPLSTGRNEPGERLRRAVNTLLGRLSVHNDGRSLLLDLDVTAASPRLAANIANTYADLYIEHQMAAKDDAARHATEWLSRQIAGLRDQIADTEQHIAQYKEEHGITSAHGTTVTAQELAEINAQLISAHSDRVQKEAAVRSAKQLLAGPGGAEAAGQVLASPLIQRLREQEADLMQQIAQLSTRYRPAHPTMVRMRAELDNVRRKMADEANRLIRAMADEASAARTREEMLKANLAELSQTTTEQQAAQVRLRELEREADASRALYGNLLARLKQISAQQGIELPDAQIVARADATAASPSPNKHLLFTMAGLLSLMGGLLLPLLLEFADGSFRRASEVEQLAALPVLGIFPTMPRPSTKGLAAAHADAVLAEALRGVRSGFRQSMGGAPLGVMMVTSAVEGEGKTSFAVALGRSVARTRLRCLVIDCHFQRPGVESGMAAAAEKGALARTAPGETYPQIRVDKASGLHYMPAPAPEQRRLLRSQDIFESAEMRDYIRRLRGHYELIILDAPPIAAIAEVVALARLADTAVFLIRWGKTSRQAALQALRVLALRGVSLAGIVLSRVDLGAYASYGHGDYVRYLEDGTSGPRPR